LGVNPRPQGNVEIPSSSYIKRPVSLVPGEDPFFFALLLPPLFKEAALSSSSSADPDKLP
jgi:hypothetical protein